MQTETIKLGRIVINYWEKKPFNDLLKSVFSNNIPYTSKSYFYHFHETELIDGCYYGEINKTRLQKFHTELTSKESLQYKDIELDELYEFARFVIFSDHSIAITSKAKFNSDDFIKIFKELFALNCEDLAQVSINYRRNDEDIFSIINGFWKLIEVKIKNLHKSNPSPKPTFEKIETFLKEEKTDEYSATFLSDLNSETGLTRDYNSHIMSGISLTDAGYGESTIKGLQKTKSIEDIEIIIINTKDRIIQSRIAKVERESKIEFIKFVLKKFSEYIEHEMEG
ncbi:MAG: hypothetical protein GQ533_08440 [Methanosarcinaceae archaeon]|nr:hypothetical protein [Methanosarcinaceae archaeon]